MTDLELAFGQALNLGIVDIFQGLFLALLLGLSVAFTYRVSVPGRVLSPSIQSSMVLLALISAMVMMVIGNNVARAFSLVGALAIIRFRTRLKSPWDITFIFFSLAVGIACGVLAYRVAIMGTFTINLTVIAMQVLPIFGAHNEVSILRVDLAAYEAQVKDIKDILNKFLQHEWLVETRSLRFGETMSYRYRVVLKKDLTSEELLSELSKVEGVERVIMYFDGDGTGMTE